MSRILHVAGAQMGPVARDDTRADVVERLIIMLREAADRGADLVVFPELALTTFFPRWWFDRPARDRRVLRDRDARSRHQAAVRRGPRPRRRLLPRLRGAHPRRDAGASRGRDPSLQHDDPGRPTTARSSTATARSTCPGTTDHEPWRDVPAPRAALLRRRARGLRGPARLRRHRRHADLQRPPLARDLPGAGPAGRRADPHRLQHARSTTRPIPTRTGWPGSTTTW